MKKQIIHVSPVQTAKVFALLYFFASLPFIALMAISVSFAPGPKMPVGFFILFPFLYLIFGFIFTVFGAWVYNLVASWVGGIEYTSVSNETI